MKINDVQHLNRLNGLFRLIYTFQRKNEIEQSKSIWLHRILFQRNQNCNKLYAIEELFIGIPPAEIRSII